MTSPTRFGRYEVREILGRGAMGLVYLAEDPRIPGRQLAIKVIEAPGGVEQNELESRFAREYRAAGILSSHPNVVAILDVGEEDGTTYVVMEYVGKSLEHKLGRDRVLPMAQVGEVALQLGKALDYAHSKGIIHRDVKPANILLDSDETPKIADFGIAKHQGSFDLTTATLTNDGAVVGTPAYMSPEQAQGYPVSGASDQFSMAVVLYRMLTGERPFNGDTPQTVMYRIVHEDPIPPATLNRSLPSAANTVILRALSKGPHDRYPSCTALARDLQRALTPVVIEPTIPMGSRPSLDATILREVDANPPPSRSSARDARPEVASASPRAGGRKMQVAVGVSAVLLVLAALSVTWLRNRAPQDDAVGSTPSTLEAGPPGAAPDVAGAPAANVTATSGSAVAEPEPAAPPLPPTGEADRDPTPEPDSGAPAAADVADAGSDRAGSVPAAPARPSPQPFQVTSDPPGAQVQLDGQVLDGVTPLSVELAPDREHQIRVTLEGYDATGLAFPSLEALTEDQRANRVLLFPLTASFVPGQIAVRSDYPVRVELSSNVEGFRPRTLNAAISHDLTLRPGTYRVLLSAPEVFLRQVFTTRVTEGREQRLSPPAVMNIRVTAFPENCQVSIDGRDVGTIPVGVRIARGPHEFQFEWPVQGRSLTLTQEILENDQRVHGEIPQ